MKDQWQPLESPWAAAYHIGDGNIAGLAPFSLMSYNRVYVYSYSGLGCRLLAEFLWKLS